jgi:hypothetical protein
VVFDSGKRRAILFAGALARERSSGPPSRGVHADRTRAKKRILFHFFIGGA